MNLDDTSENPDTGRILIPAVIILGLLASVGSTAFLGYAVVTLMHF